MDKTKTGGKASQGSGNFKDDPERAAEAGRKGGQSGAGSTKSSSSSDGRKGEASGRK